MTGFRTLAFNGLIIALAALLQWATSIDWTQYVSPQVALMLVGAANIGLRMITRTPIGTK